MYKELTREEYRKIHESLPHEDLIIARDRAMSLLKHTKELIDTWLENKPILKNSGIQLYVMPDGFGQIAFIDGWIPKQIAFFGRININGIEYNTKKVMGALYHDYFDTEVLWCMRNIVVELILHDKE